MPLGALLDAAGGKTAPVDPRRFSRLLQGGVGHLLPQQPHPVARALVGQQRHTLAGRYITIPDNQVRMRIVRVGPGLVDGGEP